MKTLSYRIFATFTTIFLLTLFGFRIEMAASAGIAINLIKTILFYLHEWLWEGRALNEGNGRRRPFRIGQVRQSGQLGPS